MRAPRLPRTLLTPGPDPTWVLDFQTGTWMEALVEACLAGGPRAAACRQRAKALLTGWLGDVPIANTNPETLMCAAEAFPGQAWIHDQILVLLDYYTANWHDAGYVFGRSGWGTARTFGSMSFYSLRFGPGTQIHGHADHMGLPCYARGRNLMVDSGHDGYAQNAYRSYLLSPEAASTLVMPNAPFDPSAPTTLMSQNIGPTAQSYEFTDTAFGGNARYRSVYASQAPDFIVVLDRSSGAGKYLQLWHLDPALTVQSAGTTDAIATAPGTELQILQVPLPGQVIPPGSTRAVTGQTSPYQGWVSRGQNQRVPAPVVTMTRYGPSADILTVIVPAAPGTQITASTTPTAPSQCQLRLSIGAVARTLLITATGAITSGGG